MLRVQWCSGAEVGEIYIQGANLVFRRGDVDEDVPGKGDWCSVIGRGGKLSESAASLFNGGSDYVFGQHWRWGR